MPKLKVPYDLSNISDPQAFLSPASQIISEMGDDINGKLEFDKNIKTQTVVVNFSAANTDTTVPHQLSKTGVCYFPVSKSLSCDVYHGTTPDNNSNLFLRCTVKATVTLVLF